jgi:hypothetical protein
MARSTPFSACVAPKCFTSPAVSIAFVTRSAASPLPVRAGGYNALAPGRQVPGTDPEAGEEAT